jgi:hypothetical protein
MSVHIAPGSSDQQNKVVCTAPSPAGSVAPVAAAQEPQREKDAQNGPARGTGIHADADPFGAEVHAAPPQQYALAEAGAKRRAEEAAGTEEQAKKRTPVPSVSPFPASKPPPTAEEGWFRALDPRTKPPIEIWAARPKNDIEALERILVVERRDNATRYLCKVCHAMFWGSKKRVKEHMRQQVCIPVFLHLAWFFTHAPTHARMHIAIRAYSAATSTCVCARVRSCR